jgi:transposase
MDFQGIEVLLGVPEFCVIHQVLRLHQLELLLQRRDPGIVCPRCQTCCARVKESRTRCIGDLPMLERPVILWLHLRRFQCSACPHRPWEQSQTFGKPTQWTECVSNQVRQEY